MKQAVAVAAAEAATTHVQAASTTTSPKTGEMGSAAPDPVVAKTLPADAEVTSVAAPSSTNGVASVAVSSSTTVAKVDVAAADNEPEETSEVQVCYSTHALS